MPIVTYYAQDADGQPLVIARLTLQQALDLAAAHLACGITPVALEIHGRRFDSEMIVQLLDSRQAKQVGD
jgi:hypothetical protein